ncbi:protein SMAX1-LIKE 8-like [Apium graveolens]|uniref:protein SMAX1-LIKE 8-like n=1 Tax=Apium graveolens TaxID=4045 RepID=UPI003D7AC98B
MPTPVSTARQCLTQESILTLDAAVAVARRRKHTQTTSLHTVSALLSLPSSSLRDACTRTRTNTYTSRMQFKALEICLSVSLDRLPTQKDVEGDPPVSNSLMAAIKRSQANQRRQPENFFVYQQQSQSQSLVSNVKVELKNLIVSILDDPIVSRVFGEAGFRNYDVKLAVLRPVSNQFFRFKRGNPVFLCDYNDGFDVGLRGFSFPFSGFGMVDDCGDSEVKSISEILVREKWRNPVLVGVYARDVLKKFLGKVEGRRLSGEFPVELCGLSVISIENEVGSWDLESVKLRFSEVRRMVEDSIGAGFLINFGDLKGFIGEGGAAVEALTFVVRELSRLLEVYRGRMWLIGVASEYEIYMKFVKGFPSIEKDWDLQVLPMTSPKSSREEAYARSSLTESFVPLGGFFPTPSDVKFPLSGSSNCVSRCHLCNKKCEEEVAALSDGGYTASQAYQFPSSLPSWLERPELNITRASDEKANNNMVLSAKVFRLQKKWDNICQRLHFAPFLAKPDTYHLYSQVPTIMGFQVVQDGKDNVSSHHANASSTVTGCKLVESSRLTDTELNATAEASEQAIVIPKPVNVGSRETAESDEKCALKTPLKSWSSSNVVDGLTSPTSVTSVTTDIGLTNNLSTSRVIEKSPNQSHKDLMQAFSGLPENCNMLTASTKNNASATSSCPGSDLCGQYNQKDYKYLYTSLFSKIGRQEDALAVISQTLARCKSGNGKRQGASRGDIWFNFLGSDGICQKKTAIALAEILYGGTESFICVDLSFKDGIKYVNSMIGWQEKNNCDMKFRGKTVVDYIADQLRRKPLSVVLLENIDRSDPQVQSSLLYALKSGRLLDSHGREVSTSNAVFVTTSRSMEGKRIASSTEETFSYSEENVVATKGRPIQIQIGFDLGDNVISQDTRVLNKTRTEDSIPVSLNKRKLVGNDGNIRQQKAAEVVKRPHTATMMSLDLNLPAEESEMTDVENFDREPLSENCTAWLDDFLTLGDETVIFKPFDFNALAEKKLKVITQCFHNIVGSEGSLEVDSQVVEQILATVYVSDSSKVDDWINQVLGQAFVEARKRYNLNSRSVVKVIPCEAQEQAQDALLPARIIMN